jgi:hypothetical protein
VHTSCADAVDALESVNKDDESDNAQDILMK